jgi:hypothetical protein
MDQLYFSFKEETLLNLKKIEWDFKTRPDNLLSSNNNEKFIELDKSSYDIAPKKLDTRDILKIEY